MNNGPTFVEQNEHGCKDISLRRATIPRKEKNRFPNRDFLHITVTHGRVFYLSKELGGTIIKNQRNTWHVRGTLSYKSSKQRKIPYRRKI